MGRHTLPGGGNGAARQGSRVQVRVRWPRRPQRGDQHWSPGCRHAAVRGL